MSSSSAKDGSPVQDAGLPHLELGFAQHTGVAEFPEFLQLGDQRRGAAFR
jgi:hypothetical protein